MSNGGSSPDRAAGHLGPIALGAGLIIAGALALAIAWHGAAAKLFEAEQWPYVVSGGFGGLALIDVGITVLRTQHGRLAAARQLRYLRETRDTLAAQSAAMVDAPAIQPPGTVSQRHSVPAAPPPPAVGINR
jgi:thiosulfate reductase cytochrome b subunit